MYSAIFPTLSETGLVKCEEKKTTRSKKSKSETSEDEQEYLDESEATQYEQLVVLERFSNFEWPGLLTAVGEFLPTLITCTRLETSLRYLELSKLSPIRMYSLSDRVSSPEIARSV